jgi:regulator of sirC expression with transglutaminase-like and TPR domain
MTLAAQLAAQFADAYRRSDATPEHLAFEIARMVYPALDVEEQLKQLDALAEFVQRQLPASGAEGSEGQGELSPADFMRVITQDLDFHGNREEYYDPRNSLLGDVLERRMGLPIMLCLVCIAIGRRLGVRIEVLGSPSHFLAVFRSPAGDTILDPFLGITLEPTEVERHLARLLGQPVNLAPEFWRALTAQEIALRILRNLRNAYLTAKDLAMVEWVLDYLIAAIPSEPQYWRERGLLHYRQQHWVEAHYDLRGYLQRVGLFASLAPSGTPGESEPPAAAAPPAANQGDRRVLEIYRETSTMLARVN